MGVRVLGLHFPFALGPASAAVRVPAVKSLHLLCQLHQPQSLARGYPTNGFPDFDRLSHASFPTCSPVRSEEHTSELQSLAYLVCRLLLEKKKKKNRTIFILYKVVERY